jgi:hypothetical protein
MKIKNNNKNTVLSDETKKIMSIKSKEINKLCALSANLLM